MSERKLSVMELSAVYICICSETLVASDSVLKYEICLSLNCDYFMLCCRFSFVQACLYHLSSTKKMNLVQTGFEAVLWTIF